MYTSVGVRNGLENLFIRVRVGSVSISVLRFRIIESVRRND